MIKLTICCLLFSLTSLSKGEHRDLPTECDRGVKRHHPSQANAFQVFSRGNYKKQWLDFACPEFQIFDPRKCQCVESTRQDKLDQHPPVGQQEEEQKHKGGTEQTSSNMDHESDPLPPWRHRRPGTSHVTTNGPATHGTGADSANQKDPVADNHSDMSSDSANDDDKQPPQKDGDQANAMEESEQMDMEAVECYLHRPSVSKTSHFERWTDGHWREEDCNWPFYTGLVWSQMACRCVWGPNRTLAIMDPENSVPAPCLMMLKMSFDQGTVADEGRHLWLNIRNKEHAVAGEDSTAVGGYSGSFRGSTISVPYFKSNLLGPTFHIGLMFKLCPGEPDTDIPILHNDCVETIDGPSIAVTYKAWTQEVIISMRTSGESQLISEACSVGRKQTEWTKLDIRYGDSYLEVIADDHTCISSDAFYGALATNNCPLTLLDESFCGNLDEVIITRGCTEEHAVS